MPTYAQRAASVIAARRRNRVAQSQQAAAPETQTPGFLQVTVRLQGRDYVRDLEIDAHVETDPIGLSQALADLPGQYAWWAAAEAEARADAKRAEVFRAKTYAERYTFFESSHAVTDGKGRRTKPTVEAIKSLVLKDPAYQRAQADVIEKERTLDLMSTGKITTQIKKDATLAVASNFRAELDARIHDALRATQARHRAAAQGGDT